MSGHPAWCASTTPACSSAAAVPLVVHTTVGRPVARAQAEGEERRRPARPAGRGPRSRRARPGPAPAGVERDPGQTTASAHPGRGPTRRPGWRRRWPGRRRSVRSPLVAPLHAERVGRAARARARPRVHPDRPAVGPLRRAARPAAAGWSRSTCPGHGGSGEVAADLDRRSGRCVGRRGRAAAPFDLLGYSLGARFALHAALARARARSGGSSSSAAPPASRTTTRAPTGGAQDEELADRARARPATSTPSSPRWLADADVRHAAGADAGGGRASAAQHRRRAWPRACAWPGPAPRRRCGTASARLTMPVLVVAGADRPALPGARARGMAARVHGRHVWP